MAGGLPSWSPVLVSPPGLPSWAPVLGVESIPSEEESLGAESLLERQFQVSISHSVRKFSAAGSGRPDPRPSARNSLPSCMP